MDDFQMFYETKIAPLASYNVTLAQSMADSILNHFSLELVKLLAKQKRIT